ncbi:MAG: ornithine carbamoyltransferase [Calditrichaeota bacterium]|nr:ornithine carbamoyltransferase [Calditrichota bacterium]MCB9391424.1 ornithine carbamoyltransferase [Calditrichota bacterium]
MRPHRDFIAVTDFNRDEIIETIALACELKERRSRNEQVRPLAGQTWGLIFHKPSLRTRISFEVGISDLGGNAIYITEKEIELGKRETISDAAQVLSRYLGGIMIRTFSHADVLELAKFADIPVINGLTDYSHPCQIMADIQTVYEKLGRHDDFKLTYVGDGNNITNSLVELAQRLNFELVVGTADDTLPDMKLIEATNKLGNSVVKIEHDPVKAVAGAHVIYTDVWASMGQKDQADDKARKLRPFQVNEQLVSHADKNCIVLHCLPAERGKEITDGVMDGPHSVVFDQAENRLHAQKAVMTILMEKK